MSTHILSSDIGLSPAAPAPTARGWHSHSDEDFAVQQWFRQREMCAANVSDILRSVSVQTGNDGLQHSSNSSDVSAGPSGKYKRKAVPTDASCWAIDGFYIGHRTPLTLERLERELRKSRVDRPPVSTVPGVVATGACTGNESDTRLEVSSCPASSLDSSALDSSTHQPPLSQSSSIANQGGFVFDDEDWRRIEAGSLSSDGSDVHRGIGSADQSAEHADTSSADISSADADARRVHGLSARAFRLVSVVACLLLGTPPAGNGIRVDLLPLFLLADLV